jgi:hypothetical protein
MKRIIFLTLLFLGFNQWAGAQATADQYLAAGNKLYLQKDFVAAVKYYKAAIQLDSKNWQAYQGLGNAYYVQGQKREALAEYQAAFSLNPNNPPLSALIDKLKAQVEYASAKARHFQIDAMGGLAFSSVTQGTGTISGEGGAVEGFYFLDDHFRLGASIGYHEVYYNFANEEGFGTGASFNNITFGFMDFLAMGKYCLGDGGFRPYLVGGAGICVYTLSSVLGQFTGQYTTQIITTPVSYSSVYPEISGGAGVELSLFYDMSVFVQGKYNLVLSSSGSTFLAPVECGINLLL